MNPSTRLITSLSLAVVAVIAADSWTFAAGTESRTARLRVIANGISDLCTEAGTWKIASVSPLGDGGSEWSAVPEVTEKVQRRRAELEAQDADMVNARPHERKRVRDRVKTLRRHCEMIQSSKGIPPLLQNDAKLEALSTADWEAITASLDGALLQFMGTNSVQQGTPRPSYRNFFEGKQYSVGPPNTRYGQPDRIYQLAVLGTPNPTPQGPGVEPGSGILAESVAVLRRIND